MHVATSRFEWKFGTGWQNGHKITATYDLFCKYVSIVGADRAHYPGFDRSFIVDDFDITDDFTVIDMWFEEDV